MSTKPAGINFLKVAPQCANPPDLGKVQISPWCAVRVRSHLEKTVAEVLSSRVHEALCPTYFVKRRWSDRTKLLELPLFPGYVFARFELLKKVELLRIPGVITIVNFGGTIVPVDPVEIKAIQAIVEAGANVTPWPYLRCGQRVRVSSGPLRGVEGIILNLGDVHRLLVSVEILQRSVAVELDSLSVEPVR